MPAIMESVFKINFRFWIENIYTPDNVYRIEKLCFQDITNVDNTYLHKCLRRNTATIILVHARNSGTARNFD